MSRHRILIDIEFTVDEEAFKIAQLTDGVAGVSDPTDSAVRDAVSSLLVQTDWASRGLTPLRSVTTTRMLLADDSYDEVHLASERSIDIV